VSPLQQATQLTMTLSANSSHRCGDVDGVVGDDVLQPIRQFVVVVVVVPVEAAECVAMMIVATSTKRLTSPSSTSVGDRESIGVYSEKDSLVTTGTWLRCLMFRLVLPLRHQLLASVCAQILANLCEFSLCSPYFFAATGTTAGIANALNFAFSASKSRFLVASVGVKSSLVLATLPLNCCSNSDAVTTPLE
jgi:hypothetical protein